MRVLAVETSGRIGSLAALSAETDDANVLRRFTLPKAERTAKSLVPEIESLLRHSGWTARDLDLICVASGPGSFTGLRLGVTVAKTLAFATGAKLVEVNTLAAIAAGVTQEYGQLWTVIDAQRKELFVASFQHDWQLRSDCAPPTSIMPIDQWISHLEPGDRVAGPPLMKIAESLPADIVVVDVGEMSPQAELVGKLGVKLFRNGSTTDAMQLVPQYFRKSAAEEKADRARND